MTGGLPSQESIRLPSDLLERAVGKPSRAAFARPDLLATKSCGCIGRPDLGDQQMRVLLILALALSLAGCEGDRTKQGMNYARHSPPSAAQLADAHRMGR